MTSLHLRAGTDAAVTARVLCVGEQPVVSATVGPDGPLGALDLTDGELLADAVQLAVDQHLPLVAHVASSGALVGGGIAALHGWGRAAAALSRASGVIPIICVVDGPAVSALAMVLGLADIVIMTSVSHAFVTGPQIVRQITGVPVTSQGLGGAAVHHARSGVASLVAADRTEAEELVAEVVGRLPASCDDLAPHRSTLDPPDRRLPEADTLLPTSVSGSYDVRALLHLITDDGDLLELRAGWAPNLVTALGHLDGRSVGLVATQPCRLAGTLDIAASQKGARFVSFCDAFNLPLITVVDTPGFSPGKDQEWRGMIRHGAQLAFAYARATVPRISLTVRKSYGGAYIVMDSRTMGNDVALAWPSAQIAVMGAKGAVEILHRDVAPAERAAVEADYEHRHLHPYVAAERGLIDAVIEPAATRAALCEALACLDSKREQLVPRGHDNIPL